MINISEICQGVSYVGVNDRTTARFENMWPIPKGVSYNSYLVQGSEKTALIDAVAEGEFNNLVMNLRLIGCDKIDFLVVNHMEPDHSGSIAEVVKMFPGVKVIGNKQTISMIGGFYKLTDPELFLEVKEGDTVDLGGVNLKFILTPMVHWPETMMTYIPERKVLFSGDAFGCFGALNGGVVDSYTDPEFYFPEMERYYACIVGKYGKFVEKAMAKLSGAEVDYICSTHGPVWYQCKERVLDLYSRMSRYEAEEGTTIIYGSMYGNTAIAADALARALSNRGLKKIRIHDASSSDMSEMIADAFRFKALIVGGPTYSLHLFPPVEQFMIAMETREIRNRIFASFGSFTWANATQKVFDSYIGKMNIESLGHVNIKQSATEENIREIEELADKIMAALKECR